MYAVQEVACHGRFPIGPRILVALTTRFMRVLSKETAFVMQNFRNLGLVSVGDHFFDKTPQKAYPWLI